MTTLALQLTELVREAAAAAGHADSPVPLEPCVPCGDPRHGDYQSNFAFRLGKSLRTNPRAVAEAMTQAMPPSDLVASVDVAGPGFLNFRLTDSALAADVVRRTGDSRLGAMSPGAGRTLVIDYSSPNIAKRMHVGHLRSTVIGNALDRLHRFAGWTVISDNHLGDWGTQFGKLIVAWNAWRDDAAYAADPIGELQRIYQLFGERSKEDPSLIEAARAETAKLQDGDPDNRALWQRFVDVSMSEFSGIYARFGIEFTVTYGESHYRDEVQPLIARLMEQGVAVEDDGAVIIPFEPSDGKGLAKQPLLIRKSDGAALYGTTDLCTLELREREWSPDLVMYVTDNRQQLHFRQVFAAGRKAGILGEQTELQHVYFGMLKFPDGAIMASRSKGQAVNLIDVLDTAVEHARAVVDAKSTHIPDEERAQIAETLGVGAVRYFDLSQNPQSDIVFDWDKILDDQGNTATYLMYAHARARSILRKAADLGLSAGDVVLDHPLERQLALAVARTPEVIEAATATRRPNLLCDHLFRLAQSFAGFYTECPVLKSPRPADEIVASRLMLVEATAHSLRVAMQLVGLTALERM